MDPRDAEIATLHATLSKADDLRASDASQIAAMANVLDRRDETIAELRADLAANTRTAIETAHGLRARAEAADAECERLRATVAAQGAALVVAAGALVDFGNPTEHAVKDAIAACQPLAIEAAAGVIGAAMALDDDRKTGIPTDIDHNARLHWALWDAVANYRAAVGARGDSE